MTADAKAKEEACERTEPEPEPESMITNDWIGMQRIEQLMSVYVHVQYSFTVPLSISVKEGS